MKDDTISRQAAVYGKDHVADPGKMVVDLVSRQVALDAKNIVHIEMFGRDFPVVPVETLKVLPPVDAVPVVRCKDCRWRDDQRGSTAWMPCRALITPNDFYCPSGERKDGEQNG